MVKNNNISLVESNNEILVALSRISAAISGLANLDAILRIGLDTTLDLMNGTSGGIMLLSQESNRLYYHVSKGLSADYTEKMTIKVGEGIAGKVAQSGKAMLLDDIAKEPKAVNTDLINREDIKAFASIPLKANEKVLGVMNCTSREVQKFTEEDFHLLHSIGDQLGMAIEQARLYEWLQTSKGRYRKLTRKAILAQEEVRKKIARDLHDETSQSLAGLALNLQALIEMMDYGSKKDSKQFKEILQNSLNLAVKIHSDVSRLIANLRPTQLETLGLVSAIRQHLSTHLDSLGINAKLDLESVNQLLSPEEELSVFRWVQGAIGNIVQHSGAKNVEVSLKKYDDRLVLTISDDGVGFNVNQLRKDEKSNRGYGLLSMKERISLIGGSCSVNSEPRKGTTVTAVIPLTGREIFRETSYPFSGIE